MLRAVLDTNVSIGILLGSRNCLTIRNAFLDGQFDWLISEVLVSELIDTIKKKKFSSIFKPSDITELLELLKTDAEWIRVHTAVTVSRDPDDNAVLACALDGKADYIVTGDKDLLVLKHFKTIDILEPRPFVDLLKR